MLYSEIFKSIQGEGHYTGVPTTWLRFFGCNLECNGFGQDDPTDPSTYQLPYKDFEIIDTQIIEDLPVWKYGCDSSYSWSKKFAKIQHNESCEEVAKKLYDQMYDEKTHIAFTGGEPLMKAAQKNTVKILTEMDRLYLVEVKDSLTSHGRQMVQDHLILLLYKTIYKVSNTLQSCSFQSVRNFGIPLVRKMEFNQR